MANAVLFITFRLAKGASVPDFLSAAETLNKEYISKLKGFISWKQLREGEVWADLLTFETMDDAKKIMEPGEPIPAAEKFYSFLDMEDMESCKTQLFSVEKSY